MLVHCHVIENQENGFTKAQNLVQRLDGLLAGTTLHIIIAWSKPLLIKLSVLFQMQKDVGIAYQKMCKQGRDDMKVKVNIQSPIPTSFSH